MATIIRSIAFHNFYNFSGNYCDNTYEFAEGLNIINADNGMGKSKMYNGFLWILKDQVYDSDRRHVENIKDSETALKILSGKAKISESAPKVGVKIIYEDSLLRYEVEKKISFTKKILNPSASNFNDWVVHDPEVFVTETDLKTGNSRTIYDLMEQEDIIKNRLISRDLLSYALLQGEAIDDIVDLSSSTRLAETIETLTNIDALKKLNDTTYSLQKKAGRDLSDIQNLSSRNTSRINDLNKQKAEIEKAMLGYEENILIYRAEQKKATELKEKLHSQVSNTEKRTEYREKLNQTRLRIDQVSKEREKLLSGINDNIFKKSNPWILLGQQDNMRVFAENRDKFQKAQIQRDLTKNKKIFYSELPEGTPDGLSLNNMIEKERCFVCGRPAEKGSEAWGHIVNVRDRAIKDNGEHPDSLSKFFSDIQLDVQGYNNSIKHIFDEIVESKTVLSKFDEELDRLRAERDNVIEEFRNYGGSTSDTSSESSDINLLNEYNKAHDDIRRHQSLIASVEEHFTTKKLQLVKLEKELKDACGDEVPQEFEDLKELMSDIHRIFSDTTERIYDEVIDNLEVESNKYYGLLTHGNNVQGGQLKFKKMDYGAINIEVLTESGSLLTGTSEGFQRMKKLAVVMAIISSKLGVKHFEYPFIADAPFSAFGKNFMNNFFEIIPQVFKQTIIMIKDLYDIDSDNQMTYYGKDILERMKKGDIQGKFYVNYIAEKSDTLGLSTQIKCYK